MRRTCLVRTNKIILAYKESFMAFNFNNIALCVKKTRQKVNMKKKNANFEI